MSPVITKGSGLPSAGARLTVVSRLLGSQVSNNQASSGSPMRFLVSTIAVSTANEVKQRSALAGRRLVKPGAGGAAAARAGGGAVVAKVPMAPHLSTSRRVVMRYSLRWSGTY